MGAERPMGTRQRAVYAFIRQWWREHHYGPSVREVMAGCGLRTTSAADYHIRALERRGLVRAERDTARSVMALDALGYPVMAGYQVSELIAEHGDGSPVYAWRPVAKGGRD